MSQEQPQLIVADVEALRAWLDQHHEEPAGVWLILAKKGTIEPTSLTYDQALDEALCQAWIDGQTRRRDESTYHQRFTPRRTRSPWSRRNVGIPERLQADGRMQAARLAEGPPAETLILRIRPPFGTLENSSFDCETGRIPLNSYQMSQLKSQLNPGVTVASTPERPFQEKPNGPCRKPRHEHREKPPGASTRRGRGHGGWPSEE